MKRFTDEFDAPATDIALCGSMTQRENISLIIEKLQKNGYSVSTPDLEAEPVDYSAISSQKEITKIKGYFIRRHFANIARAKTVLVLNYEKNDIKGYIGANTLIEMAAAYIYDKPIYILNNLSRQPNYEEILGLEPIFLNGDLDGMRV